MKDDILAFTALHPDFFGIASEWSAKMLMRKLSCSKNGKNLTRWAYRIKN